MKDFEDQDLFSQKKRHKKLETEESSLSDADLEFDFSELPPENAVKKGELKKSNVKKLVRKENMESVPLKQESVTNESAKNQEEEKSPSKNIIVDASGKTDEKMEEKKNLIPHDNEGKDQVKHLKTLHELKENAKIRRDSDNTKEKEENVNKEEKIEQKVKEKKTPILLKDSKTDIQKDTEIPIQKSKNTGTVSSDNKRISSVPRFTSNQTVKKNLHISPDGASIGHILQEARSTLGLSQDQVAIQTKIKKSYIEALERDDFENLPSMVYVKAYIRRLCQEYGIEEESALKALKRHKNSEYIVPDDVLLDIEKGKQINLEKQK
ncbi:MAG TPA: helix-turn-helix transcriptional regulator, partial [Victivallales bacterium]|nr:helix-turn-helix transcriptional regulator [Victivallales bacterium]